MSRITLNNGGGVPSLNDIMTSSMDGIPRLFNLSGANLASLGQFQPGQQFQGNGNITLGGGVPASGSYPEGIALFSNHQFGQIFPQLNTLDARNAVSLGDNPGLLDMAGPTLSGGDGGTSRSSTAYASRHQAAEQRRRTRINER